MSFTQPREPRSMRPHASVALTLSAVLICLALTQGLLAGSSAAAPAAPPAVLIPTSGAYFGSWVAPRGGESRADAIERVEAQIGRRFAIDHQYYKWDSNFPAGHETWTVSQGRIPFLNWMAQRQNGQTITWSRIASGAEDAAIIARAEAIKAFGKPMYLTFHHEPENDLSTWGTPSQYAAAFRHVVDVFKSRGVSNVAFVWTMMAWTFDPRSGRPVSDYYPGNAHVDLIGSDGYNFYPTKPGSKWDSFQAVYQPTQDFAVRHGKPWMAVEWGAQEDPTVPGRKGQWLVDALSVAKTWTLLKGLIYFDEIKDGYPWITDSSASSIASYARIGADRHLSGSASPAPAPDRSPTISLISPGEGAMVSGIVTIEADAADDVAVKRVEFLVDGEAIGVDSNGSDAWTFAWNVATRPDGPATLSVTAVDALGQSASDTAEVIVDSERTVVMVVGDPTRLIRGEVAVIERLSVTGHTVEVIDDNAVQAPDAHGAAFVMVMSTIDSRVLGSKLRDVSQPVWVAKPYTLDDMLMTRAMSEVEYGTVSSPSIVVEDETHVLAAGKRGTVLTTPQNKTKSFGFPRPSADVIATVGGKPTTFVYRAGDLLVGGGSAKGCRLSSSVFRDGPASFTAAAWAMFDAAASFASLGCRS